MTRDEVSILVVDDVNAMRVQIRELLRSFGFSKITLASNGEDAKKHLLLGEGRPYQIVLADWHMNPGSGLELVKFIRRNPDLKSLAFIMITAESVKERVVEAIQAGVDDYMMKPVTLGMIEDKVYSLLVKKGII